jgi:hypothetical protein
VQEAVWMKEFISELSVVLSVLDPMVIYYDNNGAIANKNQGLTGILSVSSAGFTPSVSMLRMAI